jgi:hypothetical protein
LRGIESIRESCGKGPLTRQLKSKNYGVAQGRRGIKKLPINNPQSAIKNHPFDAEFLMNSQSIIQNPKSSHDYCY